MSTISSGRTFVPFQINETDTLAGTSVELVAPTSGYISDLVVIVSKAVTTGGAVKVINGTTDVTGGSLTVVDGATKGTVVSKKTTQGSASRLVAAGGRIQVEPAAAFNTAGAINGYVVISHLDV